MAIAEVDTHVVYPVKTNKPVEPNDPLHVGNFYKDKQRFHKKTHEERQAYILYLAQLHRAAMQSNMPIAFRRMPLSLTKLRSWVYDYRTAFDYFFEVVQTGYNLSDESKELSIVVPKPLGIMEVPIVVERELVYDPPPLPDEGEVSKVYVQFENSEMIYDRLAKEGRFDLKAPVDWLLNQPTAEVNFWFARAGKLQLRDTSIWPIKGIETWPSWLRVALFGEGIDIESAYTQYLLDIVKQSYGDSERFKLLFPELIASFHDKQAWREDLCCKMGLDTSDESIKVVKKVCMGLANGSKVSPLIMTGSSGHSTIKDAIMEARPDASLDGLYGIGQHLEKISREYSNARRIACIVETQRYPSRVNQKSVFRTYFQWERDARYKIWEAVGRMGIMVHDGIDGIPIHLHRDAIEVVMTLGIKAT